VSKKLYLLDGMALVYRAHFALIARPIFTSKGVNTSALYGFTQTLLQILKEQEPTHIAVAFDTDKPTQRHADYANYKATRQAMPEDLGAAMPHVCRMIEALNIPIIACDGFEADDIIATLVRRAEKEGFDSYMVTQDKDFGQLINEHTFLYRPSRMGDSVEIMGLPEIQKRWSIKRPDQVVDILALMGDSIDNIPGVPGIGEKTAVKLVAEYDTVENLLAHTSELKGRVKENLEKHREDALLSKRLVMLNCDAPCPIDLESLRVQPWNEEQLKALFIEFEFNTIGKRLFGENFKAGRGFQAPPATAAKVETGTPAADLKTLADIPHSYRTVTDRQQLLKTLLTSPAVSFSIDASDSDPKVAKPLGIAFSWDAHSASYVSGDVLDDFRPFWESPHIQKIGHNLKFDLALLKWHGISAKGDCFDTMIAHSLIEPDVRHNLNYLSESLLEYAVLPANQNRWSEQAEQPALGELALSNNADAACERADLAFQLKSALEPLLSERGQMQVFYDIEAPLAPVLVDMEYEGIKLDAAALGSFSQQLLKEMDQLEKEICQKAGKTFNLGSPRQLGEILFDILKICEKPKKTRTGQYATDEQTLLELAPDHEIVRMLLEHRASAKLKSTYADALPLSVFSRTGRVHTTYYQTVTSTGRLNSQNPNLQNIPIRSEKGQEIRKAFVPRDSNYLLLSADYSQIELRIIAELSKEEGLLEAFASNVDVHTATAAKVFGCALAEVTFEMRSKAKMVNYGIAYGISAFGLAQRLGIPRKEGAEIIDHYFKQFPRIRKYMDDTIAFGRERGYVETVTGRRRYIRDIKSANFTVRSSAERNAINAPIQGTAADMIKIAMVRIHREFTRRNFQSRMLLQVHDELVFDLHKDEQKEVLTVVEEQMKSAIPMKVPIVVEMGTGKNWLEAH
jgi:DNA polymerase I